jgi:hypothetical protein
MTAFKQIAHIWTLGKCFLFASRRRGDSGVHISLSQKRLIEIKHGEPQHASMTYGYYSGHQFLHLKLLREHRVS